MVGQLYLLIYFFYQAEGFPDYKIRRFLFALTYCLDHVTCHVIILLRFSTGELLVNFHAID